MFGGEGLYWVRNKSLSDRFIDIRKSPYVHSGQRSSMPIGLLSPRLTRPQLWLVEQVQDGESFVFRNYDTGTVLDVEDGSSTDGKAIVVQSYTHTGENASSQHWKIVWVKDDNKVPYYRIENRKIPTVLNQTRYIENGADHAIVSWEYHGGEHQLWSFERATFPTMYWIVNTRSERCLQYQSPNTSLATLDLQAKTPSRSQLWYVESLVDYEGYCRIRHVEYEDRVLDLSAWDNKTILVYNASGSEIQRWKITDVDMNGVVSIVNARMDTTLYAERGREQIYTPRGATDATIFGDRYQWRLIPCPIPSLFWTTVQGRGSGKFVAQSNNTITPSDGAEGEIDYTVQWRFIPQGRNVYFTIVNRRTGDSLYNSSGSALAADNNVTSDKYYWALDAAGQDYSITNISTSRVVSYFYGKINAAIGAATVADCQWFINASLPSVPSFAIINGQTGMALSNIPNVSIGSVKTDSEFNAYRCQWIIQQVVNDRNDQPVFVIINKLTGHVLDHWDGKRIEASNSDPTDLHHQWRLVPCHKRYFALANVATGKYVHDDGYSPTTDLDETMTDYDRRCCWTFVSHRDGIYDETVLDPDIAYPHQDSHHIVKRAPKKTPKGKGKAKAEPSHIPDNPGITQVTNRYLRAIIERLIGQLDFNAVNGEAARTLASTSRIEVTRDWGLDVPMALRGGWERDGWIRIDLQGTYQDQNGVRVANIQGQWNSLTVFHVIIPLGVTFGRKTIRDAMIRSLETAESVRLDTPTNTQAGGSKKQPSTTEKPPGPGSPPAGQYWAATAIQLAGIGLLSVALL